MREMAAAQATQPIQAQAAIDAGYGDLVAAARSSPRIPNATGMPAPVQAQMESAFGADFSNVRVHAESARAAELGALAFTQGSDIHMAPGQWAPQTKKGQELLGHELTHVLQQREGKVGGTKRRLGMIVNEERALEVEANAVGARVARGEPGLVQQRAAATSLQMARLADYNDTDPKHDPSFVNDTTIQATDDYTTVAAYSLPQTSGAYATTAEALLACRLMLRHMRDTNPSTSMDLTADSRKYIDMAKRQLGTLAAAQSQVGTLNWTPFNTAAAVSDPSKLPTEFGRWVLASGPMPDKVTGSINCWEMVLFGAYKAGFLSFKRIKAIYDLAVDNVKTGKATLVGTTVESELRQGAEHVFDPADPKSPSPLPGDIVIFKTAANHVAIATGTITSSGQHEVLSLWNNPGHISTVQQTTIEALLAVTGPGGSPVKFWTPKWGG